MKRIMQYCMACIVLAGTLSSCSRQEEPQYAPDGDEVLFQGLVKNSNMISRSDFNEKDFVLINSSTDAQFGDIRICSNASGTDEIAEYEPADAWQGRLSALNTPLKWSKGTDAEYTFYACTYPSGPEGSDGGVGGVTMANDNPMQGTVRFGTQKETDLEHFIVAKEGPLTYAKNGSYVKLLFYRPVAKIQIESVTHFDAAGSQTPIKQCKIDFPNLYHTACFNAKKDWTDVKDVWLQPDEDPQLGLSWNWDISGEDESSDSVLYVHPFSFVSDEADGGQADGGQPDPTQPGYFRITATIDGAAKVYFASLAGLKVITELKAGQFMKMQIAVQDGGGGGLGCRIVDWNTEDEQNVSHRRAGIYTQKDADNLLEILQASSLDEGALNNYCRDGKNIYLYTSVDWSSVKGSLKIPDGYTLCKQGYSVTLGEGGQLEGVVLE